MNNKIKSTLLLGLALASNAAVLAPQPAHALTKRIANVSIQNMTSGPIVAGFSHKYSNVYQDSGSALINPIAVKKLGTAKYHTGFGTTGKDWWIVSFVDNKGCTYISSPRNGRKFMDGLEKGTKYAGLELIQVGVTTAVTGLLTPDPVSAIAGVALGGIIGGLGSAMFGLTNTESTAGFKQHILRSEDANITVMVTETTATFMSPSGVSTTGMELQGCVKPK